MMFGLNFERSHKKTGHINMPIFFNRYSPYDATLLVSKEREHAFDIRHYKYEVKILQEFNDNTCEIKITKAYVDNDKTNKLVGGIAIVEKDKINFKV